jgi:Domain of unknown function (DUF5618)
MAKPPKSPEPLRYLNNARDILRQTPAEREVYTDLKRVREAMGTAYLAVLEGINAGLLRRGVGRTELPKSVDAYRLALQRHMGVHNGKLLREFESLYDVLHLSAYYRARIYHRKIVREALDAAQRFIERVA